MASLPLGETPLPAAPVLSGSAVHADRTALIAARGRGSLRLIMARCATRPFAWRMAIALAFVFALVRLINAYPLPHGLPAVRLSLTERPGIVSAPLGSEQTDLPALPGPGALLALDPDQARASNAAVAPQPFSEIAPPFRAAGMAADARGRAVDCLAAAAWYEAGDNPPGERAVAQVVLNRVRHPAFPKSVCAVVFQDSARSKACQFTFACDGSLSARVPGAAAWTRARAIALAALAGMVDSTVGLATHYHADYVVPRWRDSLVKMAAVGPHLFYRWPGTWGSLAALRPLPPGSDEPHVLSLARLSPAHVPALPDDDSVTQPRLAPPPPLATRALAEIAPAAKPTPTARLAADPIDLTLDPAAFPGSYAVRAYALCKDHPRCLVLGHTPTPGEAIPFLFLHDARKGVDTALWNCARTPRPDRSQCLPDPAATARLIVNWQR
jgi:spore germination cell wall hydrolase CwlJ-like protein